MRSTVIALVIPVTSRRRDFKTVEDTDFVRVLLPSLLATASWTADLRYRVYLGYDADDPFYDSKATIKDLEEAFKARVGERPVELKTLRCEGTAHSPAWVWNALFEKAHKDGADYFYQIGDDVEIETPGWAEAFMAALQGHGVRNLGVSGPLDTNNPPLLTQAFVSRVHRDVFGGLFPKVFKNWYTDNWIQDVYSPQHLVRVTEHRVRNKGGTERYAIDHASQGFLRGEVDRGRLQIANWIAG